MLTDLGLGSEASRASLGFVTDLGIGPVGVRADAEATKRQGRERPLLGRKEKDVLAIDRLRFIGGHREEE